MQARVSPGPLAGSVPAIASKSMAHRLIICAALADAPTEVVCNTTCVDIETTVGCLNALGARIERTGDVYRVEPVPRDARGRLACASYINKVYVRQEPTIVIPGGGERVFGQTQDDELVFALPAKFIETTAKGIEAVHQAGYARYPTGFHGITAKPKLPGKYYKYLMPSK